MKKYLLITLLSVLGSTFGYCQVPNFEWAKRMGSTSFDRPEALAVEATGNVFTTGFFTTTADFDPGTGVLNLTSAGGRDIFITKFDPDGNLLWVRQFGATGEDQGFAVSIDNLGNIYLAGTFQGTVDFDPGVATFNLTAVGSLDMFLIKLDSNGDFLWANRTGSTNSETPYDIAVDVSGNIYVTGFFNGTVDFNPRAGVFNLTSAGTYDIFITKLTTNGDFIWARRMGGTELDEGRSIAVDNIGNVYTTGYFRTTVDFDPGAAIFNLTSAGNEDIFVSKLDVNGNFMWAVRMGEADFDTGQGIAVDGNGVYTTGYFLGTADFDPGAGVFNLTSAGVQDIFVSKLDVNGSLIWAKNMGGTARDDGKGIAVDGGGNVYTTGFFNGTVDFDPGPGVVNQTSVGALDVFISKLSSTGNFEWVRRMGGNDWDQGADMQVDGAGNVYLTGHYRNSADFDPGPCNQVLNANIQDEIFVLKLKQQSFGTDPTVTSFVPLSGNVGTTVTITGTNFDPVPTNNIVEFNGIIATVTASTATSITTTVPGGFTTGKIIVTVGCVSVQSGINFTTGLVPTITSFTPLSGPVGTTITITGTDFSTTPADNIVKFNGIAAVVTASTTTSITTSVPSGATTGKITVTVAGNTATSAADFTVIQNFITRWNLATAGSGVTQLSFGTATSGSVSFTWQEISPGSATGSGSWSGATLTITGLPTGATIRLQIAPTNFQRIIINNGLDRRRLTQVEQWGTTAWTSMQDAFDGCENLQVTATDVPDLSGVTNMSEMFRTCINLNSPCNINTWNTGTITNMSGMFANASAFNQNISSWNTGSATNISGMFSGASAFNQNISSWNTGAVTNMSGLFANAVAFNQNIGAWNTASVTNMSSMLSGALVFNRNIGAWNTAAVTDMNSMFFSAYAFNQNISGWNTAAVTNMGSMFGYDYAFNQNIGSWNTSAVTNMSRMFEDAFAFNQNIGTWNTSAVINMTGMFIDAYAFNQNIGTWNTSAVTTMERMFDFATAFNQNIGAWNTAAVTDMRGMFADASAFNQNIGTWSLNPGVLLTGMLNNSGINCSNYSATLLGWSTNPSTPNGRTLGAVGRQYGTNAVAARTNLTSTKSWTITGDTPSGAVCSIPVPTISNFTPTSGPVGTTVTISGTNFSTTPANNIVYFGAVQATVTAATTTQLTVTVPTGATFKPITVSANGLISHASKPFVVSFAGGAPIDNCSFTPAIAIGTVSTSSFSTALCDLDGDGKIDLLIPEFSTNQLAIFRNTSVTGTPSFAPKIPFTGLTQPIAPAVGDLDGDGKPDIAVANYTNGELSVYKNLSTPGTISVATRVTYSIPAFTSDVSIADMDGDGKQDLIISASIQGMIVMRNQGFPGIIDATTFAAGVTFATGANAYPIALGDLDGDGKLDAIVPNANTYTLSLLRNSSTPGVVSFAAPVTLTTNTGTPTAGYGTGYVSLGDIDGDSKLDIAAVSNTVTKLSLFRNTSTPGSLTFDPKFDIATTGIGAAPALSDLNGDGKLDLVADNGPLQMLVFESTASPGTISATTFKSPLIIPRAFSSIPQLGDVDGDGRNDIISTSINVQVFRNLVGTISPPILTSFTPSVGIVGSSVTITGTNFSSPFPTTVLFNGISATISSSTATTLTVTVPMGATTGLIDITVGCTTIVSSSNYTVGVPVPITITLQPTSPNSVCEGGSASFDTAASGTTNIIYQWQFSTTLTGTYNDITNGSGYSNVTTPSLFVNTTGNFGAGFYRCKINGDLAITVFSNAAELVVNATPVAPLVTPASSCVAGALTLTTTGGTNGQYRWYNVATGGTAIVGEVNDSYTTPVIGTTTTYYVAINDGTCESLRASAVAQINVVPAPPTTTNASSCGTATVTVNASGGSNGQYRWYDAATGGTAISGEVNSSYSTPLISTTTAYYVAINNGTCESLRATATAQINVVPSAPVTTSASGCLATSVTLTATGGSNGQYRWYTVASGGTPITGEVNNTYSTPVLSATTTFYVSINNGTCESTRAVVVATVTACATNQPPVIQTTALETQIDGEVILNLLSLISDPDNNIDLTKLTIVIQPKSGAVASIDATQNLIIDYTNIAFTGTDELTIEVCDLAGSCTQQKITIEVAGDIVVYNGISPNDDDQNPIFNLKYIDTIEATKNNVVSIYNRWGSKVFEVENYNNTTNVFTGLNENGNELPSGTYFYKIQFTGDRPIQTGYLVIKR